MASLLPFLTADESANPPGEPKAFDVVGTFSHVQAFAGRNAKLSSIYAAKVKSDGTINLRADDRPRITYEFIRETETAGREAPYERVSVTILKNDYPLDRRGYVRDMFRSITSGHNEGSPLPSPSCSFRTLWELAIQEGAAENATATIYYGAKGYKFTVEANAFERWFTSDCKLVEENLG